MDLMIDIYSRICKYNLMCAFLEVVIEFLFSSFFKQKKKNPLILSLHLGYWDKDTYDSLVFRRNIIF